MSEVIFPGLGKVTWTYQGMPTNCGMHLITYMYASSSKTRRDTWGQNVALPLTRDEENTLYKYLYYFLTNRHHRIPFKHRPVPTNNMMPFSWVPTMQKIKLTTGIAVLTGPVKNNETPHGTCGVSKFGTINKLKHSEAMTNPIHPDHKIRLWWISDKNMFVPKAKEKK